MLVPSTPIQLLLILLIFVPGIAYSAVRRRLHGPTPEDKDFSFRLANALFISIILDIAYIAAFGPHLLALAASFHNVSDLDQVRPHLRALSAWAILLLILVPTCLAIASQVRLRRSWWPFTWIGTNVPIPSAWDFAAPRRGGCFVRIRTGDGYWVGGFIGQDAFASTYPEPKDIFIDVEWHLDGEGKFIRPVEDSYGIYVPLTGSERVAWVAAPQRPQSPKVSLPTSPSTLRHCQSAPEQVPEEEGR